MYETSYFQQQQFMKPVVCGLFIRLLILFIGSRILDKLIFLDLKYTDIDYHIYSDAASLYTEGFSPYERATYRYPPFLALLLSYTNVFYIPEWGKLIFSIADVGIIYFIYLILKSWNRRLELLNNTTNKLLQRNHLGMLLIPIKIQGISVYNSSCDILACWLWALNPLAINICTRGSADSITNILVLIVLELILSIEVLILKDYNNRNVLTINVKFIQKWKIPVGLIICGFLYWLLIHLRLYPVIYLPGFTVFLLVNPILYSPHSTNTSINSNIRTYSVDMNVMIRFIFNLRWSYFFIFFLSTILSFIILTWIGYIYFGWPFIENAILYHMKRLDHRHNFSPLFYGIYLSKSTDIVNKLNISLSHPTTVNNLYSASMKPSYPAFSTSYSSYLEIFLIKMLNSRNLLKIATFIPQVSFMM